MSSPQPPVDAVPEHIVLPVYCLTAGFFALFGLTLLSREVMAVAHGADLAFGPLLAGWLLWSALGAVVARLARPGSPEAARRLLFACLWLMGPLLAAQMLAVRFAPGHGAPLPGEFLGFGPACVLALVSGALPALLAGFQFALALSQAAGRGALLGAGAAGAVAAGFLTALTGTTLSLPLPAALALGGFIAAGAGFVLYPHAGRRIGAPLAALIILAAGAGGIEDAASLRPFHALAGFAATDVRDTPQGRLVVLRDPATGGEAVFQNGLELTASAPKDRDQAELIASVLLGQRPGPAKTLFIGPAASGLPQALLEQGAAHLDLADLSPEALAVARRSGLVPDSPKLGLIAGDGRRFVAAAQPGRWDLAALALPEPDNVLAARYLDVEFFRDIKAALVPGGTVCLLLPASLHRSSPGRAARTGAAPIDAAVEAAREVFREVAAAPLGGTVLIASDEAAGVELAPRILAARCQERLAALGSDPPGALGQAPAYVSLDESVVAKGVLAPGGANMAGRPLIVLRAMALAGASEWPASVQGALEPAISGVSPWWIAAAVLAFSLALRAVRVPCGAAATPFALLASACAGCAGMTLTLACLLYYQNDCGLLYVQAGMLCALFLAGFAGGFTVAGHRPGKASTLAALVLLTALALGAPWWLQNASAGVSGRSALMGLLFFSGLACGGLFPGLAVLISPDQAFRAGKWLYAAALAGACLAALAAGPLVMPLFGATAALNACALLTATAALGLAGCRGQAG